MSAMSVAALAAAVARGERDPRDVVANALERWRQSDRGPEPIHAFLAIDESVLERQVDALRAKQRRGEPLGPLAGVPVAVKDNITTVDLPTTCASRLLDGYRPPYDATCIRRLRAADALVFGKTNLDEFAMGSSTEFSAFGPTRNPHDRTRVPGGSSGGSAAAVAAGIVPAALGSDTGGSVRQPAAFCGVVGLKPTYGRISRYGLVAFASSLDQIGVFGATVADAARVYAAIAGPDPRDATSLPEAAPPVDTPRASVRRIGVVRECFPPTLDSAVATLCRRAVERWQDAGIEVVEVSVPSLPYAVPTYYILATAEASANLARYDGVRYGVRAPGATQLDEVYERTRALFGPEVKRRIILGTYVLSAGYYEAYYARAQRMRARLTAELEAALREVDALFLPTAPTPAFRLGERLDDPLAMYLADVFTVPANLAGLPALSFPVGRAGVLPVGGQLVGRRGDEATVITLATVWERMGPSWTELEAPA
jgi:aspartyl-tRNA(Asn)/glutamyl-tRNA(Gln) amidotransferase subunit A